MPVFEEQIYNSEKGFFIDWRDLSVLSKRFHQVIGMIIIGCKDQSLLRRYESDQEMYEICDICIEMHDSCFWEVFSKDMDLINRLAKKIQSTKPLETDFQNSFNNS